MITSGRIFEYSGNEYAKTADVVEVLHKAVSTAMHAVSQHNIDLFKSYFVSSENNLRATEKNKNIDAEIEQLKPRIVRLDYIRDTPSGPVQHTVDVPLISLVPVSNLQATEVNFEFDLECVETDGEIMVAFPQTKRTLLGGVQMTEVKPNAKLTIKINAVPRPAGVTAIIEGFDKNLRAQIPN